jgi:hypothetical protein
MNSPAVHRAEIIFLLLLVLAAFGVRLYRVGSISLAEDEAAKWQAIQEYRHGHFVGVNSEHPMLMKVLAWGSLELGERWNRWAGDRRWLRAREEALLRMPNLVFGALTTIVVYLLGKEMIGGVGAGAAAFFWAFTPMPIALNRILKEDTLLTFFTLLGCYLFWRGKKTPDDAMAKRLFIWSGICFGLSMASKYVIHYTGLTVVVWHAAGQAGLDSRPFYKLFAGRFWLAMGLAFVLANPIILSPANDYSILHYMGGATHMPHGYYLNGQLFMNKFGSTPFGLPWYFYLWVLAVKTPLPVLMAFVAGVLLLLQRNKSLPAIFLRVMFFFPFFALSLTGAKWIRYLLPLLPFFFLIAGYAIEELYRWMRRVRPIAVRALALTVAVLVCGVWPAAEAVAWTPYCPLYVNQLGGGRANAAKFFPQDELYDLGLREAIEYVSQVALSGATIAVSNPVAVSYYLQRFGRTDIQVGELFDLHYVARPGDYILVQESRRYFETQELFYLLERRSPPLRGIVINDVLTVRIYRL